MDFHMPQDEKTFLNVQTLEEVHQGGDPDDGVTHRWPVCGSFDLKRWLLMCAPTGGLFLDDDEHSWTPFHRVVNVWLETFPDQQMSFLQAECEATGGSGIQVD